MSPRIGHHQTLRAAATEPDYVFPSARFSQSLRAFRPPLPCLTSSPSQVKPMGANRNGDVQEVSRKYHNRNVCHLCLAGLCPHDLFQLTIKNPAQLDAALSFLTNNGPDSLDVEKFAEACGVGYFVPASVVVSIEEIKSTVAEVLKENMEAIMEQRYRINVSNLSGQVRKRRPWGDAKATKVQELSFIGLRQFHILFLQEEIDRRLADILGPKTEADNIKPIKKKKEKPAKFEEKKVAVAAAAPPSEEELNPYIIFPQPEENFKVHTEIFFSNGDIWRAHNTKEILEKHLKATGGKVMTRFPPEPNGYLHIGHAKAMFIDFGLAKERNGHCYLRFLLECGRTE